MAQRGLPVSRGFLFAGATGRSSVARLGDPAITAWGRAGYANKPRDIVKRQRIPSQGYFPKLEGKRHDTVTFRADVPNLPGKSTKNDGPLAFLDDLANGPVSLAPSPTKSSNIALLRSTSAQSKSSRTDTVGPAANQATHFAANGEPLTAEQFRLSTLLYTDAEALWARYQRLKETGQNRAVPRSVYHKFLSILMDAGRMRRTDLIRFETPVADPGMSDQHRPLGRDEGLQAQRIITGDYFTSPPRSDGYGFPEKWRTRISQLCRDWVEMISVQLALTTQQPRDQSTSTGSPAETSKAPLDLTNSPKESAVELEDVELIVRALVATRNTDQAWQAVKLLAERGLVPKVSTLDYFATDYARRGLVDSVEALIDRIRAWGLTPNVFQNNALIRLYAGRAETLPRAQELFADLRRTGAAVDSFSYCPIIMAAARANDERTAYDLCRELMHLDTRKEIYVYNVMLWSLGRVGRVELMWQLYHRLTQAVAHGKARDNYLPIPDKVTYGILMDVLMKRQDTARLQILQRDWLQSEVGWSAHICNSWMTHWIAQGQVRTALRMLQLMPTRGINPTAVNYLSVITGLCAANDPDEALRCLALLESQRLAPTAKIFNRLIHSFAGRGDTVAVASLRRKMAQYAVPEDTATQNALLAGLIQLDRRREAVAEFERWIDRNHKIPDSVVRPDVATFQLIIPAYLKLNESSRACDWAVRCCNAHPAAAGFIWLQMAQASTTYQLAATLDFVYRAWRRFQLPNLATPLARSSVSTPPSIDPDALTSTLATFMLGAATMSMRPLARQIWTDLKTVQAPANAGAIVVMLRAIGHTRNYGWLNEVMEWAKRSEVAFNLVIYHALLSCYGKLVRPKRMLALICEVMPGPGAGAPVAVAVPPTEATLEIFFSFRFIHQSDYYTRTLRSYLSDNYPHLVPAMERAVKKGTARLLLDHKPAIKPAGAREGL
ncbi:hypothetical protein IWQ60_008795 [Tieghemiomyces parasiticus]|uniref:Uncharacterized protein n=1 Tax=Tieghemiomyces parasiticus TaxID=78921 RepID=A0A9W8DQT6_9FUNG|nr:hypothetical protein IWQ60_008795 [Tieghemiomyces parasiticus]